MKNWFLPISLAGVLVFANSASLAGQQDFTLVNKTGYEIDQVYVSPTSTDDWEEDVLGQDTLTNGERVNISFPRKASACKYDLKVVYVDDDEAEWDKIDLCKVEKVTLHWNKKSGESTATLE